MKTLVHSGLVGRPGESETGGAETWLGVKCRQNSTPTRFFVRVTLYSAHQHNHL